MNISPGIIMDLIIIAIVLFSTVMGIRSGFAATVISFTQWFICIILALFFTGRLRDYLIQNTGIDDYIYKHILQHLQNSVSDSSAYMAVPDLFSDWVKSGSDTLLPDMAFSITTTLMTVISFLLIILGVKIIGSLIAHLFSKKYHDGVIGFIDGFFGFLFGILRGIITAFVFLAVMIPVLSFVWPEMTETALDALKESSIAGYMYDNNFLLILLRDLFS